MSVGILDERIGDKGVAFCGTDCVPEGWTEEGVSAGGLYALWPEERDPEPEELNPTPTSGTVALRALTALPPLALLILGILSSFGLLFRDDSACSLPSFTSLFAFDLNSARYLT
jgi:hypothetical protein